LDYQLLAVDNLVAASAKLQRAHFERCSLQRHLLMAKVKISSFAGTNTIPARFLWFARKCTSCGSM
jgi:hypothetical protein